VDALRFADADRRDDSGAIRIKPDYRRYSSPGGGRFHPKAVLLVSRMDVSGHRCVSCFVGSANLKESGIGGENREFGLFVDEVRTHDATEQEWKRTLLVRTTAFFQRLTKDNADRQFLEGLMAGIRSPLPAAAAPKFECLDSFRGQLLGQLRDFARSHRLGQARELIVVSPSLPASGDAGLFDAMSAVLNAGHARRLVITRPVVKGVSEAPRYVCPVGWRMCVPKTGGDALHAKLIVVDYGRQCLMVQGSANFTGKAWLAPVHRGGNVELVTVALEPGRRLRAYVDALHPEEHDISVEAEKETPASRRPLALAWFRKPTLHLQVWQWPGGVAQPAELSCHLRGFVPKSRLDVRMNRRGSDTDAIEYATDLPDDADAVADYRSCPTLSADIASRFLDRVEIQIVEEDASSDERASTNPWLIGESYIAPTVTSASGSSPEPSTHTTGISVPEDVWPLIDECSRQLINLRRAVLSQRLSGVLPDSPIIRRLDAIAQDGLGYLERACQRRWHDAVPDGVRRGLQGLIEQEVSSLKRSLLNKNG
jgi:hypothetical protein